MWLSFGVRMVWVVHPQSRSDDGDLDGHDVLPGVTCPVPTIFRACTAPPISPGIRYTAD